MNARQQRAIAEFERAAFEVAAQDDALPFEREQRLFASARVDAAGRAPAPPMVVGPAIDIRPRSSSTIASSRDHARARDAGGADRGIERRRRDGPPAISGSRSAATQIAAHRVSPASPAATRRTARAGSTGFLLGQEPGGHERVVQFVGVARIRARLVAHARDRLRIERPRSFADDGSLARRA